MSKVLKPLSIIGAIALTIFAPPLGAALGAALGVSAAVGSALVLAGAATLSAIGNAPGKRSTIGNLPDLDRMNLTSVAAAPRKMVFGTTAMAADLRYTEPSGTDQRFIDAIVHVASHTVQSVDEIRFADKVAWTAGGGVQGIFVGFLTVEARINTGASNHHTVNGGAKWGSAQRMTGCTTLKLRFDRQATKKAGSPFSAGIPNQIMTIGKGMPVYDPRRDSTVPGGSGSHRIDDQATWQYTDGGTDLGNNPALQALAWLVGWRIMGQVSVGLGIPPARIDLVQFAAAANICDEDITLAAGGSQKRYQGANVFPDNAPPLDVMSAFANTVAGWWDDSNGKLGLYPSVNDLTGSLVAFGDDDILSAVEWDAFPEIGEVYNVARGTNPDPALPANYQPTDYPEVRLTSGDGIDRFLQLDFAMVQNKARAQRLAKQALQRHQYRGVARLTLGIRAWQLQRGQPIKLSFGGLGWLEKLFRVESWSPQLDGSVIVTLREENAAIYAWATEETAPVVVADPVVYDPRNNPFLITRPDEIGSSRTDNVATEPADPSDGDLWRDAASGVVTRWDEAVSDWVPFVEPIGATASAAVTATTSSSFVNTSAITLGCGPGGTVVVRMAIDYQPVTTTGAAVTKMQGALDYRTTPGSGSWIEIAAPVDGTLSSRAADIAPGEPAETFPGKLIVEASIAGPGSVTNWEFRGRQRSIESTNPTGSGSLVVRSAP
jgi:hypothetical protein